MSACPARAYVVLMMSNSFQVSSKTNSAKCFCKKSFGAHYGGSPYSMTDPFYMLVLIENLGREHIVGQDGQDRQDRADVHGRGQGRQR